MKIDSISRIFLIAALASGVTLPLQADTQTPPASRGDTSKPDGQRPPPQPPARKHKHRHKKGEKPVPKPAPQTPPGN